MKARFTPTRTAAALGLCLIGSFGAVDAATDTGSQFMDFLPNADETSMVIVWYPPTDDFGPRPPCNLTPYTLKIYNDGAEAASFSNSNFELSPDSNGNCHFKKTLTSGAVFTNKISPGVWTATATKDAQPAISDQETIYACTAKQGKTPAYWLWTPTYTDHFFTTSASERDAVLGAGAGYSSLGTGFAMPAQVRFGSVPFYRTYKGAPQFDHFYTTSQSDLQFVTQNGYTYEGMLGHAFSNKKPGSVSLYRFGKFDGATGDLQHLYSTNRYDGYSYGMSYEGVAGFVCPR